MIEGYMNVDDKIINDIIYERNQRIHQILKERQKYSERDLYV